jgi:hypothetical protein
MIITITITRTTIIIQRGEVDEWAAMLQLQGKIAEQGASEYEMMKRAKQREYMVSLYINMLYM